MEKPLTYVEQFVRAWAERCVDEIRVERANDNDIRIRFGTRSVFVPMAALIVHEEALRAIARAVEELLHYDRVEIPTEPPAGGES